MSKEVVGLIVSKYINTNYKSWIPRSISDIIVLFYGVYDTNFESNIIDNKVELMEMLCKELKNQYIKLKRIYSGTLDGFAFNDFHDKCDNKGPTLTVVSNEHNAIFGGYTKISWNGKQEKCVSDSTAFLYQLKPNITIFNIKDPTGYRAVYHDDGSSGDQFDEPVLLCFGPYGPDLWISEDCNTNKDSRCRPRYYNISDPALFVGRDQININSDAIYFRVKDLEIFQVN